MTAGLATLSSPHPPASCALSFCVSASHVASATLVLRQPSHFASALAPHTRRPARAAGPMPSTHCSSSSPCTCSRRGAITSRWRSWTFRRHSSRAAACRKRPLGAGATACPPACGDAWFRSGLLYALRVSKGTPAAPTPAAVYMYGAAVSACQRRSFFAPFPIQDPGADRTHGATHRGRELLPDPGRGREYPLPRGARPPHPNVGATPVVVVLVSSEWVVFFTLKHLCATSPTTETRGVVPRLVGS